MVHAHCTMQTPKATNTQPQHVIMIAFPLQQCLQERASVLRYVYIACLVFSCTYCQSVIYSKKKTVLILWFNYSQEQSRSWIAKEVRRILKHYSETRVSLIWKLQGIIYIYIYTKKKSYRKWLNSKKLEDKLEYKRNTALAKREVRKRQRLSWNKFVTNLEHDTYRTQPKVYKILNKLVRM